MAIEGLRGKVGILGYGQSKFAASLPELDLPHMSAIAYTKALGNAGIAPDVIEHCVYGHYNPLFRGQIMSDIYVNENLGFELMPTLRVAAGGATGAAAVDAGVTYGLAGRADVILVLGFEKGGDCWNYRSQEPISEVLKGISFSADTVWEEPLGVTAASNYATTVNAFRAERGGHPTDEEATLIAMSHHENALLIPDAHCYGQEPYTFDGLMNMPMIAEPFRRGHNCQITEGAAALILITEKKAKELKVEDRVVWITGVGASTDTGLIGWRPVLSHYKCGEIALAKAYEQAGVTDPREELGLVEIHDAFAHVTYMAYLEIGLAKDEREASGMLKDGLFYRDGRLPVNLSGGLIGMGHPVGATNIAQAGWIYLQLTGQAGSAQVSFEGRPMRAALKGMGGPGDCYCYGQVFEF